MYVIYKNAYTDEYHIQQNVTHSSISTPNFTHISWLTYLKIRTSPPIFCPKREIMLLPSNIMTLEEILQCYSHPDMIRQGWSDHLSSLQQSQLIACSGSLNNQCKIFQSLILKLMANFMPIETHNYYKKAKEMGFIFPSEVPCSDFHKAVTNPFIIS